MTHPSARCMDCEDYVSPPTLAHLRPLGRVLRRSVNPPTPFACRSQEFPKQLLIVPDCWSQEFPKQLLIVRTRLLVSASNYVAILREGWTTL